MELVLLRQGKPAIAESMRLTSSQFGAWVNECNQAGIDLAFPPTKRVLEIAAGCDFVICSHLPSSIESAKALDVDVHDSLLREFEMPYANMATPKLSVTSWSALYRVLWLAGFCANAESYRQAKLRGLACVEQLLAYANKHQRVLFIGHGALLWFICKQLLSRGWSGQRSSPRSYWDFNCYSYSEI